MLLQRHLCSVHVDLMLQCTSGGGPVEAFFSACSSTVRS
jgi:hypothetical protein